MAKSYARMSVAEKTSYARGQMREPSISCPICETQTTVGDLLEHLGTRCQGRREPHPLSDWISWAECLALGVRPATLHRWVRSGTVRSRGERDHRQYLRRDVVARLALRRVERAGTEPSRS